MTDAMTSPASERALGALEGLEFEEVATRDGITCIAVEAAVLHDVLQRLRDAAGFETMTFVTAVDRHPQTPRFEVNHQLHSKAHNDRIRVKTAAPEDDPRVPTCVDLWPGAGFMERECFDMFGVVFEGSPDPRRLLMPEEYGHHPLRKDFPHQGIEPDRLYREWDKKRRESWDPES